MHERVYKPLSAACERDMERAITWLDPIAADTSLGRMRGIALGIALHWANALLDARYPGEGVPFNFGRKTWSERTERRARNLLTARGYLTPDGKVPL